MVASIIAYVISGLLCTLAFIGVVGWALDRESKPEVFVGSIAILMLAWGVAMLGGI